MPPAHSTSYRRGYVACLSCRARKVRCVLGSEPPCAKCRREHRECLFQKQERTGKRREAPKWTRQSGSGSNNTSSTPREDAVQYERSRGGSAAENLQAQDGSDESPLTDPVMSTIFTRPRDALNVLFDAAQVPGGDQGELPSAQPGSATNLVSESGQVAVSALSQPSEEVLDLWDKCRFVRQGWFTAQEAVTYLDLYVVH